MNITSFKKLIFLALPVFLLALTACSSGDSDGDDPILPSGPDTAAEYTTRGWEFFESGDFDLALADFIDALSLNNSYGPAYAGRGWTQLQQAATASAMQTAKSSFDLAVSNGSSEAYVLAGRSSANFGFSAFSASVTDAQAALTADNNFSFTHRPSFNGIDLNLLVAGGYAGQSEFNAALDAAHEIADSGLDPVNPSSWSVQGTVYTNFEAAVLAYLQYLFDTYAG
ncbi:MAG: hypothetical protein GY780_07795 [bacterium]|nr:hypothetical protein [bacterium]